MQLNILFIINFFIIIAINVISFIVDSEKIKFANLLEGCFLK